MSLPAFRSRFAPWSRGFARAVLVVAFSAYAAAKFAGAQFITSGGILDKPVADLRGIELTWVYFGYSPLYANFVAVGRLVCAMLLTFNRTARLGAAALLPITANIVVVNFGFSIGTDTQIVSSILLVLNLYLLAWDLPAWKRFLWDETADNSTTPSWMAWPGTVAFKGAAVVALFVSLFWLFVIENGPPGGTPSMAGEWLVESATLDGRRTTDPALGSGWRWICFEPDGRFSVRTNRWTFRGRYTADASGNGFTIRYDPEPLPPVYHGPIPPDKLSPAEERHIWAKYSATGSGPSNWRERTERRATNWSWQSDGAWRRSSGFSRFMLRPKFSQHQRTGETWGLGSMSQRKNRCTEGCKKLAEW